MLSHRTIFCLLVAVVLMAPLSALAQIPTSLSLWPEVIHKPPSTPSCYTIFVPDGAYMTLDLELIFPWGPDVINGWPTLDANGEASICTSEDTVNGTYIFTGVRNSEYPGFGFTPIWVSVTVAPIPPVISSVGVGCLNWDCIWMAGTNFQPHSRVIVYSADWTRQETYYGPAWQASPPLHINPDNQWMYVQVADQELRASMGWDGVYFVVVNIDGGQSAVQWVKSPEPRISRSSPSCPDGYCIQLAGSFPWSAYVDLRVPGGADLLQDAYTDLVVTESLITLRLSPSVRQAYDSTGLYAWVVNPTVFNWSSPHYLPPVDRSITGYIDGIVENGGQYYLTGWACAKTYPGSIEVVVYAGGPSGVGGTLAFGGTANMTSEPAIAEACDSSGSHHRFMLQFPPSVIQQYRGQPVYVHGISPLGLNNSLLGNSGSFTVPGTPSLISREYIYLGDRVIAVETQ